MSVKKEKYYIAVSPNMTASSRTVYRQVRYGVKVVLMGIEYFATGFTLEDIIKNPRAGFTVTEARTGLSTTVNHAMHLPEIIKESIAKYPDVKVYPLITAKQMKRLQDLHVEISLAGKGEGKIGT